MIDALFREAVFIRNKMYFVRQQIRGNAMLYAGNFLEVLSAGRISQLSARERRSCICRSIIRLARFRIGLEITESAMRRCPLVSGLYKGRILYGSPEC